MSRIPAILMLLLIVASALVVIPPTVSADATDDHFLVMNDVACTIANLATDGDCWSHTSGGAGGAGVPGPGNDAFLDGNSGVGVGNIDADLSALSWCARSTCNSGVDFAGTINVDTPRFLSIENGDFTNAGTLTIDGQIFLAEGDWNSASGIVDGFTTLNDGEVTLHDNAGGTADFTVTLGALTTFEELNVESAAVGEGSSYTLTDATTLQVVFLSVNNVHFDLGSADVDFLDVSNLFTVASGSSIAMDGIVSPVAISGGNWIQITDSTGTLTDLNSWTNALVEWEITSTIATTDFQFYVWGLSPGFDYELYRNDVLVATETANANGEVSYFGLTDQGDPGTLTWRVDAVGTPPPSPTNPVFAVTDDVACTDTTLATDAGCWAATSGGAGGVGVPDSTETAIFDVNSGAGGTVETNMNVLGWCAAAECSGGTDPTVMDITVNGAATITIGAGGFEIEANFANGCAFIQNGDITVVNGNWDTSRSDVFNGVAGTGLDIDAGSIVTMQPTGATETMELPDHSTDAKDTQFAELRIIGDDPAVARVVVSATVAENTYALTVVTLVIQDANFDVDEGVGLGHFQAASTPTVTFDVGGSITVDGFTTQPQPNLPTITWITINGMDPAFFPAVLGSITQWTTSVRQWGLSSTTADSLVFDQYMNVNQDYDLILVGDHTVATEPSDDFGQVTFNVVGDDADGGTWKIQQVGGGGSPFVPRPTPLLSTLPGSPTCDPNTNTIFVTDTRPEAENAVLYVWEWGDGTSSTTSTGTTQHTYAQPGTYTITVRVQDTSGRVETFSGQVILTASGCAILNFAALAGPWLLALLILILVTILIQIVFNRTKHTRVLGAIAVALAIIILVFVIYGWPLELPGHVKFA
jgi:PKD domain-containing protein